MTTKPIPFGLVEAVFTSEHVPALFRGKNTHEPCLSFVAQLLPHTQDVDWIRGIVSGALPPGYDGNSLDEIPRMVKDGIRKNLHRRAGRAKKKNKDPKTSEECLDIARQARFELFHDPRREGFIAIRQEDGGWRCNPVRSEATPHWVRLRYFRATGKPIAQQALTEVIDTLEAQALFEAPQEDVHLRVGGLDRHMTQCSCSRSWCCRRSTISPMTRRSS